jgi:hypothetical protein
MQFTFGIITDGKFPKRILDFIDYNLNLFYHNNDDCVLTSKRKIWTFPERTLTESSIIVKFDKIVKEDLMKNIYGICGDDFNLVF